LDSREAIIRSTLLAHGENTSRNPKAKGLVDQDRGPEYGDQVSAITVSRQNFQPSAISDTCSRVLLALGVG
jgi:hypothetical protein